jgi:hypothetical protein
MNHQSTSAYGLWSLVIINSAVFIIFAYSSHVPAVGLDVCPAGARGGAGCASRVRPGV